MKTIFKKIPAMHQRILQLEADNKELTTKLNNMRIQQMEDSARGYEAQQIAREKEHEAERCAFWVATFQLEQLLQIPGSRIDGNRIIVPSKMNNP